MNTPLLQIPTVGPNQTNKEVTINTGFSIIERSLNDIRGIDLSSDNAELNMEDYTRAFLFETVGNTVARTLVVPASTRLFAVYNGGSEDVTVECKDSSSGLTATVPPASFVVLFNNGEDIRKISDSATSGQVSAFLSLPDTPASFEGEAGRAIVVNQAESGLEFGTIQVNFTDLQDGPSDYAGQAGNVVRVNAQADGITFGTYIDTFAALTDTPTDYVGQAGRMVVVSADEQSVEFQDVPEGVILETRHFVLPNAAFEMGDLTHWIVPQTSGSVWTVDNNFGVLGPVEESFFVFHDYDQGPEPTAIAYEIDLLDLAYPEELDDEADIEVRVYMASLADDFGYFEIEFFDESDQSIAVSESPHFPGTDEWIERQFRTDIPEGARKAIVFLHAYNNINGEDPDNTVFAFDWLRVSLKLTVSQINDFVQLFDTPLSYEGFAGYMVVVKQEENGLEFVAAPTLRDNFVQLLDTPVNYSGAAGHYVRVNSGGNGLEFVAGAGSFIALSDTPGTFEGNSNRQLRVNSGENALEFFTPVNPHDFHMFVEGTMEDDEVLLRFNALRPFRLPQDLSGSFVTSEVAATSETVFTLHKNGSQIGSFTFAATATTATFTFASNEDFAPGDVFSIEGPSTADTTLADIAIGILANRI